MTDYAPFPEAELERLAKSFAIDAPDRTNHCGIEAADLARMLRSAVASYKALNERCLRAELARDHGITEKSDAT